MPSAAKKIAFSESGPLVVGGFAADAAGASDSRTATTVSRTGIQYRAERLTEHLHDRTGHTVGGARELCQDCEASLLQAAPAVQDAYDSASLTPW